MIKDVNLSEFYSSFIPPTSLMFLLNGMLLIFFMLIILQELPIQGDHHLLCKGTPCQSWQLSIMKTRWSECLRRFWICDIQDQAVVFSTKFTDLTVILILLNVMQMVMSFRMCLKLYMNIIRDILTNQVCSLLNWSWFAISQQRQAERKSGMWSQRLFQAHYSFLTESSFQEHSFWALRMKLTLRMGGNIGGGSLLKQHLPCWGNMIAVVFPKWLELGVTSHAHSALTSFGIGLACGSSLKP